MNTLSPQLLADRYALSDPIGVGTGSIVRLAVDLRSSAARVAVKIVSGREPPTTLREFFLRETAALSRLRHENIIRLLDHGTTEGVGSWLVLEYAWGGSLEDPSVRARYGDEPAVVRLLRACASALSHAHLSGVIHRDIKPSNVLFDADFVPKLADFNVSRILDALREEGRTTLRHHYTERYAAPERGQGVSATERSDVYSLGVVVAELLLQDVSAPPAELRKRVLASAHGEALRALIGRMLSPVPEERPTAPQVLAELLRLEERYRPLATLNLRLSRGATDALLRFPWAEPATRENAPVLVRRDLGSPLLVSAEPPVDGSYKLVGARLRYYVKPVTRGEGANELLVTHAILLPDPEAARTGALRIHAEAHVTGDGAPAVPGRAGAVLEELHGRARAEWEEERERTHARRALLSRWDTYLEVARRLLERDETLGVVRKASAAAEVDGFDVTLDRPVLGAAVVQRPVCYRAADGRTVQVGVVVGHDHDRLRIAADANLPRGVALPPGGTIVFDATRELANLNRQRHALRTVRTDGAVRSGLFGLLASPGDVQPPVPASAAGANDLDESGRRAVETALGTDSFFLVQGPPGTGKTTVIARLVAEIRRLHPTDRVLVASQSNIAVDNVLERLERLLPETPKVRLGNPEKISETVRALELRTRLRDLQATLRVRAEEARERLERLAQVPASEIRALIDQLAEDAEPDEQAAAVELATGLLGETIPAAPDALRAHLEAVLRLRDKGVAGSERVAAIQRDWRERLQSASPDLERHLLRSTPVIAGTCIGFIGNRTAAELAYEWVIVDEAGRATPPELLVPLSRGHRFILVGDHRQLPPILDDEVAQEVARDLGLRKEDLARSLFEELFEAAGPGARLRLGTQYRMHPEIGELVSRVFYDGELLHGVSASDRPHGERVFGAAVRWLDAAGSGTGAQERKVGTSFVNHAEAACLAADLRTLVARLDELGIVATIGVLAAYQPQVEMLRKGLGGLSAVEVLTVDAAQGKEFDFVYYSAVRSNPTGQLGFLADERRLNVALSRARHCLTIVGDAEALRDGRSRHRRNPFGPVHEFFLERPDTRRIEAATDA
ncbi:MAG: AAA domain-containing protein [Longimicrobiaceae bacterium]